MAEKSKLVKPENTLKKKVGYGGFDETVLLNAQKVIEENTIDFRPLALELLESLKKSLAEIHAAGDGFDREKAREEVLYPLMQLKAQGALFRYPLISQISFIVVDFLDNVAGFDADVLDIVEAYKNAIHAVISLQIRDDGHAEGKALCEALTAACNRYYKAKGKLPGLNDGV